MLHVVTLEEPNEGHARTDSEIFLLVDGGGVGWGITLSNVFQGVHTLC